MANPKCGKCREEVRVCHRCNGKLSGALGSKTCSDCGSTGYQCRQHGKNW